MITKKLFFTLALIINFVFIFGQNNTVTPQDSTALQALYDRIISLDNEVRNNPNQQVSNFTPSDSTTLPVGLVKEIGNKVYIICIDSARFTPEGAFFSVYMALDFPDSPKKIAFAAKNVQFNPQGVVVSNGARLQLVSKQEIQIGPKTKMVFKDDGKNFIEWDCNGYKQAGLSIDFEFSKGLFINAINPANPVTAGMELVVQDLNDITFNISEITPFYVKGAKDFKFHLQNIVIDRSEFTTPGAVTLSSQTLATLNNDKDSWKGFYAQNATITLPEKLSKSNNQTEIYASNLIIDDAGLTGEFGANNLFSTDEGKTDGNWGFSVSKIGVKIENNHLKEGSLEGDVEIPILDDAAFEYTAEISETDSSELEYNFTISPDKKITINAFKSKLDLEPSSKLSMKSQNNKFVPSAKLNGSWTVDFEKAKVKGLKFQDLTISTNSPYITDGTFSLVTSSDTTSDLFHLPISINSVGMNYTVQQELSFSVGVGLNLGSDSEDSNISFAANTTLRVDTKRHLVNNKNKLQYDKFSVDDIGIDLNTSAFSLEGVISVKNNDPTFGDLFYGSISLKINDLLDSPIMVSAGFGKISGYKYWFTDASVPITIPLVGGVSISSVYGGVQNKVSSTISNSDLLDRVVGEISVTPGSSGLIPFEPDQSKGLTFRAGVGLNYTKEDVFNGEAVLTVAFNSSGGFEEIDFLGRAYMMVKREDRDKANVSKVYGNISMSYNNSQKVFDTELNANIIVPNKLTGALNAKMHIDQNDWYFWLNRPSDRAYLNLVDVFNINTYFMIGTQIDPIPAPPSYVTNLTGAGSLQSIDLSQTGNGNGFATGVQFAVSFGGEFPKTTKWRGYIQADVGGGFDLMLFNVQNAHCSGSSDPIGVNGYYCNGQVYAYMNGSLGVKKYKDDGTIKDYPLGALQMAALLQGKLPKPTFVYGAVGIHAEVVSIINFDFTADVEFGNDCNIVY